MSNTLKKIVFSVPVTRFFTRKDLDSYELINFQEQGDEESSAVFEAPDNWNFESARLLAEEAACVSVPAQCRAVEENTVPSWLWRHVGQSAEKTTETSVRPIFDRVVGSACYAGWKEGLFADESEARAFFDEARYALAQRFIGFEPRLLASMGLDWAYGIKEHTLKTLSQKTTGILNISNATLDSIVSGEADRTTRSAWQRLIKSTSDSLMIRFADTEKDWGSVAEQAPRAVLDLMAFRHNDGSVNSDALRHATRLTILLFDLHAVSGAVAIGFCNLAPLLMALALPYDSNEGRATAAAISAIVTAEAYATSAELADLRGMSPVFAAQRETVLRALRNHRRAAYGDRNDYEKIAIVPAPLVLAQCPDLALVATARCRWDYALETARLYGVRHTHLTALFVSPVLALFMESATQGVEPVRTLRVNRDLHAAVPEALARLGYDRAEIRSLRTHVVGAGTLMKAPVLNQAGLRSLGFDAAALERVEAYLPFVKNVRLAFTPWVLGEAFCRKVLKLSARPLQDAGFDMLRHLGFSEVEIAGANRFCYGHESLRQGKKLRSTHVAVFACGEDVSPAARIRMAAAVQGFISGSVSVDLTLSAATANEELFLGAWRQGVKSLAIHYDVIVPALGAPTSEAAQVKHRKIKPSAFLYATAAPLPRRTSLHKAGSRLVSSGAKPAVRREDKKFSS